MSLNTTPVTPVDAVVTAMESKFPELLVEPAVKLKVSIDVSASNCTGVPSGWAS